MKWQFYNFSVNCPGLADFDDCEACRSEIRCLMPTEFLKPCVNGPKHNFVKKEHQEKT